MADSLVKEVDDALRADRMNAWWRQNKKAVIAFIMLLIAATAANSIWQHYREVKGGHMLAMLSMNQKLLEQNKAEDAAKGFKTIADGASGEFKDLALVWESRALLKAGKKAEAIEPLKLAVASGSSLWADIACLRLAGLDATAATPCLAAQTKSPLASTRAEWSAATLWATGDTQGAMAAIDHQLGSKNLTADSRERLMQWRASITAAKGEATKSAAKPEPKLDEKVGTNE